MRHIAGLIPAVILALAAMLPVHAQAAESIWLAAGVTAYKSGDTVIVTVNAASVTPIQGFTFQIRYDPACLQPVNAASPIPGMNGLSLPQTAGLVDASFASTTPQAANGVLAEVRFLALGGCQTGLVLESAALAVRNASGFAAALPGISIGQRNIALSIEAGPGAAGPTQPVIGTPLPLGPQASAGLKNNLVAIGLLALLMLGVLAVAAFLLFRKRPPGA
jgi:hypothetical protein